jgi:sulfotransferase family protein
MHVMLSYPKSGRTWLRFMIDSYRCRVFDLACPNVFDAEEKLKQAHPIEWTHLTGAMIEQLPYWSMGPWRLREPVKRAPWLVLTRNFQATLASAYYQARDRIKVFDGSPSVFLRDPHFGAIKLVSFYNLFEQVRPELANCHVFSYEAMMDDPRPAFERIVRALGLRVDDAMIDEAIEQSSFENMKRLSVTPAYAGSVISPTDPSRPETFKVRSAGRSRKPLFTKDDIAYIDRIVDDLFLHKDKPDYSRCLADPRPVGEVQILVKQPTSKKATPHDRHDHRRQAVNTATH